MKRLVISALLSAPLFLMAAQPGALPAEAIEQAKRDTARAGGELGAKTFQVDAQGNIMKDAQGNPLLQSSGLGGLQDGLRLFQTTTGTKGVSPQSSPSAGGGVAAIAVEQSFDLQCTTKIPAGLQFSAAGFTLRPQSCVMGTDGKVLAAQFRVCNNSQKAGVCTQPADFTGTLALNNGSFVGYQGFEAGMGCNSAAQCRVTIKGSQQVGSSASELEQKSAQMAGESNVVGQWRDMTADPSYSRKMLEVGQPLAQCAELNADGAATGRYVTCDGRATVALDSSTSSDNPSCGSVATCLQESVSQRTTTRSCVRTFPMTERTFLREYQNRETCVLRDYLADKKGVDKFGTDSNSCVSPDGSSRLGGLTKVGDTPWTCVQTGVLNDPEPTQPFYDKDGKLMTAPYPDPLPEVYDKAGKVIKKPYHDPVEECVAREQTQYWVGLNSYQTLSQSESPSPVGGQCDENPLSESRLEQCESSWFGRTLSDAQCSVSYRMSETETIEGGLNFQAQWGCGFCTKPRVRLTCQAVPNPTPTEIEAGADDEDDCLSLELKGCSLTSASALTFSGGDSGIPTSQRETYTCVKEERQCTRWSAGTTDSSCIKTDMALGLDKVRDSSLNDSGSFNNAMVAASLLDGVAKGSEGQQADQKVPLIFNGEDNRCNYPTGAVGSLITKNCCRQDLYRPKKGFLIQKGCGMEETKLAAARRSRYAHYVGEYCSKKLPWPFKTCIRRTQTYCVFQGILPRLVHEQGREQLAQMVGSSGASEAQKSPMNFAYYDTGEGRWSPAVTVNGVRLQAWRWPKHCANLADAAEARMMEPDANGCPATVTTWFAACDKQGGCGTLTDSPEFGAFDWTLKAVDGLKNQTSAVSKYSVVTGACSPSTGNCTYEAAAWPIGVGGKAVVTKDLTWPLFSGEGIAPAGEASAQDYVFNNVGDLMFRMYPAAGAAGGALPANVRLGFSRDGGQTWTDAQLPTQSLTAAEATLPGSDIRVTGSCSVEANTCNYRITGTVTVQAKPWGTPENPSCTGFTAGQLAALDFSKMDLTEWLETVMDKATGNTDPTALAASANERFQQFNSLYQSGKVSGGSPVSANYARVTPPEGFGPFNVRLVASAFWPEYSDLDANNTERVTRVEVDWGDCSPREQLQPVPPAQGQGFGGAHSYKVPDDDAHACLKTGPTDKLERNVIHKIKLYVTTQKASYTRELSVENAWAVFPGADSNNDFIEERKTVAPYGSNASGAPASITGNKK